MMQINSGYSHIGNMVAHRPGAIPTPESESNDDSDSESESESESFVVHFGMTIRQTTANHRKPPQTTTNHRKRPQTTTKWHKSPQTTTNHHQNLGRLVVKTVESRQTTANHRKPPQTTANHHQNMSKKESNCQFCGLNLAKVRRNI